MAFPPAHILVGAGAAELLRVAVPLPRWKAWAIAGALAVAPDFDFGFGILMGRAAAYHGTFTHSVLAVVVVSLAGALAGRKWALLAGAGYGSHLMVDLLDARGDTNVLLGWPLIESRPGAIASVFPIVPFEQGEGVVRAALSLLEPPVLGRLLHQTAIGGLFFLFLLAWAGLIRLLARHRERRSERSATSA